MSKLKNRIQLLPFSILLILALIGCKTGNKDKEANKDVASSTYTLTPSSALLAVIDSVNLEIKNGAYGLIDRFMVIQNKEVLADFKYVQDYASIAKKYDTTNHQFNYNHPDWHPFYRKTQLHSLQSVTKSVTSILLGIAFDLNEEYNVKTKVMPLFKDYTIKALDERKKAITIEDLLTMRSGLEWNEDDYTDLSNDCIAMELSDEWIKYVLNKPMDTIAGKRFEYNSGASVLLGKIVRIITGQRIDKWAEEKLFEPLGISDYYWKKTPDGEIDTEGGLYLKAEDLAKIGALFLNNGVWNNKQIVSESWVTASVSPVVKDVNPNNNRQIGYGYQWWIPEHSNGESKIFAGNGYGGQFLMVVPEHELIVVFNGWNINDTPEKSSWRVLQDRIIPELITNK
ncbi:serine hydrolase domain-containing protein [Muriicola sp. Z0-33]|uniref:serine hydrolase domain-containing protein n=1 Tax=Muriicola sp. Z0-33 TaxID=2816957 RepID=UPI002238C7F2|nr:serine hydrolase [Muriicola sp. Z0-33]MCW5516024.1 serine hydrolase [Muriicola sp. Z0-33]